MFIGNIPQELRVSRKKKGAAILLGQIPEVCRTTFAVLTPDECVFRLLDDQWTQTQLLLTTVPGSSMPPC